MTHPAQILRTKLEVETEFGAFLGDTRIRLLEAIAMALFPLRVVDYFHPTR